MSTRIMQSAFQEHGLNSFRILETGVNNPHGKALKPLKEQLDNLLFQPVLNLNQSQSNHRASAIVTVIDTLDECEPETDTPIRLGFKKITKKDHQDQVLEISGEVIEHDISCFLRLKFSETHKDYLLPLNWPGVTNMRI
jgi:hypothetical protein